MGEIANTTMTKKRKKKGRPSLLELQKRALKQQQYQQEDQQHQNPSSNNPNSFNASFSTRSTRRNLISNPPEFPAAGEDDDDDDDDERKQKKHKLLVGLNSQLHNNNHHHYPNSSENYLGLNSNSSVAGNPEAASKNPRISAGRLRYDGQKFLKATDSLHGSLVEPGPTTTPLPDKKLLVFILDRLQKKDTYGVFSEPVDPDELPDYHDIIKHPMDFSTARKKLDEGAYANLEQFEQDVLLICSNAMQYNSPDTIYYRQARSMQELAKKDFENLRQDSDDAEDEPQLKVVRRGRPPGKMKKTIERSPLDRVGPELSSGVTPVSGGDVTGLSNGYNLRKTSSYKYQPSDASAKTSYGSHGNESYATWLTEWENEFPASVLKAVMKYGKKPFAVDENRRDTYKHSLVPMHEASMLATSEGEWKQLMAVGLNSEHGYARSLARFAADLGPAVWKIASKKIQSVLPTGIDFGPGWVGESKAIEVHQLLSSDNQQLSSSSVFSNSMEITGGLGLQGEPTSSSSSIVGKKRAGGLSLQSESTLLSSNTGGIKPMASVPVQQKQLMLPNMNGLSGGFGYYDSSQMGIIRPWIPIGQRNVEHTAVPRQMLGMVSTANLAFNSISQNGFKSLSETSGGLIHSGSSSAVGFSTDLHTLDNVGHSGKPSGQGLSTYHEVDFLLPGPPDLNVGFLASNSPSSSAAIGSPQQPDLALQL